MFKIPTVTRNLLIINFLAFIACVVYGTDAGGNFLLNDILGLHFFMASDFHLYQLVTYMFMHGGIWHILFNMFAVWMFGQVMERAWGPKKFLFYYISCGVGAGLFQEAAQFVSFYMQASANIPDFSFSIIQKVAQANDVMLNQLTTVGASGAVFAILLAFGMTYPNERMFIFPLPIPIKAKWFVAGYAAFELYQTLAMPGDDVAHIAHLGGMVFGFFMIRYWNSHPSDRYGQANGAQMFGKIKNIFGGRNKSSESNSTSWNSRQSDWDHNANKRANQEEIDRILDKIRKSGYDSLTTAEKQKLFDQSK